MEKHRKIIAISAASLLMSAGISAMAQPHSPPAPIVREAMSKLSWLEGEWRGEGWSATPNGAEPFFVSEKAHFHVDDTVLVVHGRGWVDDGDGGEIEVHKAFGVLSYDAYRESYNFDAFIKEGYQTRSSPIVGDKEYRWSHPAGPDAEMRYHARLTAEGDWLETGERCVKEKCTQILEMRLKKVVSKE